MAYGRLVASSLVVLLVAVLISMYLSVQDVQEFSRSVLSRIEAMPPLTAAIVLFLGTALTCPLGIPTTAGNLSAGAACGVVNGSLSIIAACTVGAAICFLIARYCIRGYMEGHIAKRPSLCALDRAVECDGFPFVVMLRLSPVFPFTPLSYALGASNVKLGIFCLGTAIGVTPGVVAYCIVGSGIKAAVAASGGGAAIDPTMIVTALGTLISVAVISVKASRIVREATTTAAESPEEADTKK